MHYDALTNLINRKAFEGKVEEMLQQGDTKNHCFTITHVDINGFKFINNSLGNDLGDLTLKDLNYILQRVWVQAYTLGMEGLASIRISINFWEAQLLQEDFCIMLQNTLR